MCAAYTLFCDSPGWLPTEVEGRSKEELFSSAFLSSSQICIGDECKVIGSVISHRAHVAGAVEVNVTFYLVETFISMSVQ